jgi:hypothetical protein
MSEELLTEDDLNYIIKKADFSLLNNVGFIYQFTTTYRDIAHITPYKKLIFIKGNKHTGLEHIMLRHNSFSHEVNPLNKGFVETSKFNIKSKPLFDYSHLSELLYTPANLNEQLNKLPNKFDLYNDKINETRYILLLYKDTKVVHTLYPDIPIRHRQKKKYRRGKLIFEVRGVQVNVPLLPYYDKDFETASVTIPYYNHNDILCYAFQIIFLERENIEKMSLLIYSNEVFVKFIQFKDQIHNPEFSLFNRVNELQHNSLKQIDEVIELYENGMIKENI